MRITQLKISGYRSIRSIDLRLKPVNVIVGANGTGKSNLYRALYLLSAAASGQLAAVLAKEGGMTSALWAGKRSKLDDPRFMVGVRLDDLSYKIECGRVPHSDRIFMPDGALAYKTESGMAWFSNDPDIKVEKLTVDYRGRDIPLLTRKRAHISARNMDGRPIEYPLAVTECESVLSGLREPHLFPDLSVLRQEILGWRFYHHFRTDLSSPLRREQIPTFTPILSHDGRDVASALATILPISGPRDLQEHLQKAFPEALLQLDMTDAIVSMSLKMPGFDRPFSARELSDGTLQYLCLLAALLTPRPPNLMVLNEPETSIHPDLFGPLAALILAAGKRSQLIVTTHAHELAAHIKNAGDVQAFELEKVDGETRVVGAKLTDYEDEDADEDDNEV